MEEFKPLTAAMLKRGGRYNWIGQPERLVYLKRFNGWHQFEEVGRPGIVWCEVLDNDLHMLEETRAEWSGSPDPEDPDNYWIDDATGERVNAHTGERTTRS